MRPPRSRDQRWSNGLAVSITGEILKRVPPRWGGVFSNDGNASAYAPRFHSTVHDAKRLSHGHE